MPNIVIAIDGPSGSGKSTVTRGVASKLGYVYVDSGSFYRGVAWWILRAGIDPYDTAAVERELALFEPQFFLENQGVRFKVKGKTPVEELRTQQVNECVSPVSAIPAVRRKVVSWLRSLKSLGSLVMEGRDIGTAVFPDAEVKIYLEASPEERARRRHAETKEEGISVDDIAASLARRDKIDSTRKMDPLTVADDAVVIDSTDMTADDVVSRVIENIAQS